LEGKSARIRIDKLADCTPRQPGLLCSPQPTERGIYAEYRKASVFQMICVPANSASKVEDQPFLARQKLQSG
jgi:hypothetical protein